MTMRAVIQVVLTLTALGSSGMAFYFAIRFREYTVEMDENFNGEVISRQDRLNLPCLRNVMPFCSNEVADQCSPGCCPPNVTQGELAGGKLTYMCTREPLVGLYCQDASVSCGRFEWCRDFADIPGDCRTEVCQADNMVSKLTVWCYFMSAIGVLIDIVDVIIWCAWENAVVVKSVLNMVSSCVKWIAFGIIVGGGTQGFMADLYSAKCYNRDGMTMVGDASNMLVMYMFTQVFSAILSLILAPFSSYYGGKLLGVPYVK